MDRTRSTAVTALLSCFALLATLPAPCVCLPEAAAVDHGCCAPPAGYRVAADGCCVVAAPAPENAAARPEAPAVAGATLSSPVPTHAPVLGLEAQAAAAPLASPSPPLTVRRL